MTKRHTQLKRLQKILKRRKQLSLDGTNQQASVVESFQKENKSDNSDRTPQKFRKKENRRDTTRGKSKSEKKKLSCQKDDAEKDRTEDMGKRPQFQRLKVSLGHRNYSAQWL
jgi:hypothetical protein